MMKELNQMTENNTKISNVHSKTNYNPKTCFLKMKQEWEKNKQKFTSFTWFPN